MLQKFYNIASSVLIHKLNTTFQHLKYSHCSKFYFITHSYTIHFITYAPYISYSYYIQLSFLSIILFHMLLMGHIKKLTK